jgi:type I restriction enzyme S subunit
VVPPDAGNGIIVADIVRFRGNPQRIDNRFLSYFLNSPSASAAVAREAKGTTRSRVNLSNFKKVQIPLPPLTEQRHIVEVLDGADMLRAKRREAIDQVDSLSRSVFLDMFASTASEDWPLTTIEDVAAPKKGAIRTGPFGSQLLHSEFVDSGIAVLGIDNAVQNRFRWAKPRYISAEKYHALRRYTVHPGDVLITIMGTCGRCAIVPNDVPTAINTKHLCCITLDQSRCLPVFLHSYFLHHPLARRYLRQTAKGAVMDGLNMDIIRQLPLRLPPLSLQVEFDRRVSAIAHIANTQQRASAALDTLFASLQHRAFRGEL